MRSAIILSIAALAGSALAAPSYQNPNIEVVIEKIIHTVYVTEGTPEPTPCPEENPPLPLSTANPTPSAAAQPPSYPVAPPPVYEPQPAPAPAPAPAPEPAPAPSPSPAPAPSTGGYMDVVRQWRAKLGLKELEFSAKLEANARKTVTDSNGQMVHQLNADSLAQVLAPGKPSEFLNCFVGGWLCEKPQMQGLGDSCKKFSVGWDYQGQTDHADILTSPAYTKIGCACVKDIWGCDLA